MNSKETLIPPRGRSTGRTPKHNFHTIEKGTYREYPIEAEGAAHAYSRTNKKKIKLITRRTKDENGSKRVRVYRIS